MISFEALLPEGGYDPIEAPLAGDAEVPDPDPDPDLDLETRDALRSLGYAR